ncbi:dipeptidyl aminopeptidase/acylaminoacyl peptidase [Loktanella ponticola]|uniref:Dipeptidyl aminopeptidase/acylaminoacyl peptidase n=1 Tax=Yoonia ponticola TaxID=1524255 RepID=A0A7W9BML7_9RHOB|nr:DUF2948 family protein [Yoonia ponticola]MBB5723245.1 dipeptidyl aminopeptidase/acylaminoacyl peptidase [Yoonia ponticola]
MSDDARFEDGGESPLRLKALDGDDLTVLAALVQDAVFPASEMRWDRKGRRFAILLNRFRWEDVDRATTRKRDFERVQSVLMIEDVIAVKSQGVDARDADMVHSLLSIAFHAGEDGTGRLELTLAGDGAVAVDVETLEVVLRDVTRPYVAPSKHVPTHDL